MLATERFAKFVLPKNESGCLLWKGRISQFGYGTFWFQGSSRQAHRVAWILAHDAIPEGMHVLHRCDVRNCVNVDHLFIGTNADNCADKVRKGRSDKGENHPAAKLTEEAVRMIRRLEKLGLANRSQLGRLFGVSHRTLQAAATGVTWRHVEI